MANITFLSSEDFIVMGTRQKTLGITVPGNVLVFFKMKRCPNCAEFEPVFARLASKENRVTHAVLDVTDNRDVIISSRETNTPIAAVPVIILYINGRPHAKFSGTKNIPSIQNFITKALQANTTAAPAPQQQFMPSAASAKAGGKVRQGGPQQMQGGGGKAWVPDIGAAPSMKGIIKGAGGRSGYAQGMNVDDDDEPRLMIPDTVIPHNAPWEADFVNQDM
jgi:hypothetical protein